MCKILIKLADKPETGWKPGDIISVHPDDFIMGKCECPPCFDVIEIPAPVAQVKRFVGAWVSSNGKVYRNSLWRWDFENGYFVRKSDGLRIHPQDLI